MSKGVQKGKSDAIEKYRFLYYNGKEAFGNREWKLFGEKKIQY